MIDVVIPYCDGHERLASILLALASQIDRTTGAALGSMHVYVADDASDVAPDTSMSRQPVQTVRLEAPGFHPAGARNAGAALGWSDVIVFLDGDTVPSPTYIDELTAPIMAGTADVTTGHRSHADFAGLDPSEVAAFVGRPDGNRLLAEPAWLREGLERTDRLRSGSSQIYQYVISAVIAVRRTLFEHVGGFDERFDSYGGEDWELAYRCWNSGAEFVHVETAVAFHDGPDIEGRDLDPTAKTVESLRIADLVPASTTRLAGVSYGVPDIDVVRSLGPGDPIGNATCVMSLLAGDPGDLRLHLVGADDDVEVLLGTVTDQRIVRRDEGPLGASRCTVTVSEPVVFGPMSLDEISTDIREGLLAERRIEVGSALITVRSQRLYGPFSRRAPHLMAPHTMDGGHAITDRSVEDHASWSRSRR